MTMRGLFAIVFTVQMGFGGFVFADAPPPSNPNGNENIECADTIRCSDFLYSFFYDKKGQKIPDKTGSIRIAEQLRSHGGKCEALVDRKFLQEMLVIWDAKTEAHTTGFDCPECKDLYHQLIPESTGSQNKDLQSIGRAMFRSADCAPGVTKNAAKASTSGIHEAKQASPPKPPVVQAAPPANVDAPAEPAYRGRQSSYDRHEPVEVATTTTTGGGGSFMNSNLMWGLGGALIGGLIGYQLGKNSMQNQYPPYWQQLGPRPPPFGQVPGPYGGSPFGFRPGLPLSYPLAGGLGGMGGMGGLGGPPMVLPYGQFGQPGFGSMTPINGYTGGFNNGMPLGATYPGSYGLGTSFNNFGGYTTPIYNYGTRPMILPAR